MAKEVFLLWGCGGDLLGKCHSHSYSARYHCLFYPISHSFLTLVLWFSVGMDLQELKRHRLSIASPRPGEGLSASERSSWLWAFFRGPSIGASRGFEIGSRYFGGYLEPLARILASLGSSDEHDPVSLHPHKKHQGVYAKPPKAFPGELGPIP